MYNRNITRKQTPKTQLRRKAIMLVRDEIANGVTNRKDFKKQVQSVIRWLESQNSAVVHMMDSGNL